MKKLIVSCGTLAMCIGFSCTTVQKTRTTKTTEIYGPGIMHVPVLADLKVREAKAVGTATAPARELLEKAKAEAIANAIENSKADVLVEPVYKTEFMGARVTVTVTGFPAQYVNFRNATAADTSLMKIGYLQKPTTTEKTTAPEKKKAGGAVIGILTTVVLVVLLIALI